MGFVLLRTKAGYSSPLAGDEQWARTLTESVLDAEFFSTQFYPLDSNALGPGDPRIVSRLLDAGRPAGYRVLISSDPVTTEKAFGGKHVGKTVLSYSQTRSASISGREPRLRLVRPSIHGRIGAGAPPH